MTQDYAEKLELLKNDTLTTDQFSHRDHIGVAFEALRAYEYFEASFVLASGLQRLTVRAGATEKFNATVTMVFMSLIAERMEQMDYSDGDAFLEGNPDLLQPGLLKGWYSPDRMASGLARKVAVMPDIGPQSMENSPA